MVTDATRYFMEGPNGTWRASVHYLQLEQDAFGDWTGHCVTKAGKQGEQVFYTHARLTNHLTNGSWMEVSAADLGLVSLDVPSTVVELVW